MSSSSSSSEPLAQEETIREPTTPTTMQDDGENDNNEENVSDSEDVVKPGIGGGRSTSFHSLRLKDRSDVKVKLQEITKFEEEDVIYEALTFLAIRCEASDGPFFVCQLQDDYYRGVEELNVTWIEPDGSDTEYRFGYDDVINESSIIGRIVFTDLPDGRLYLAPAARQRILDIVKRESEEEDYLYRDEEEEEIASSPKPSPRASRRKKSKADEDEDHEDDEDDENGDEESASGMKDDEDEEVEDVVPKRKRAKTEKSPTSSPRTRRASTAASSAAAAAVPRSSGRKRKADEAGLDDIETVAEKAAAPKRGGRKAAEPKKAAPKKPKKLKKGDPDPRILVVEKGETFFGTSDEIDLGPNVLTRSRTEPLRAVLTKNLVLWKKVLEANDKINGIHHAISAYDQTSALSALVTPEHFSLEFLDELAKYVDQEKLPPRISLDGSSLRTMSTGYNSRYTFGHHVGKVGVSRGGKEGNNVFEDSPRDGRNSISAHRLHKIYDQVLSLPQITPQWIDQKVAHPATHHTHTFFSGSCLLAAVLAGRRDLAHHIAIKCLSDDGHGLNNLHVEALNDEPEFSSVVRAVSVCKKTYEGSVTPLHFASINPNPNKLKKLLKVKAEYNVTDQEGRKPIHYAARCESTGPLEFLMSRMADLRSTDNSGYTPLMQAVASGRLHNVEFILNNRDEEELKEFIDHRATPKQVTLLHIAITNNHLDILKFLVEKGANLELANADKLTPLMTAASLGSVEAIKILLEGGAKINATDRRRKSALTFAVRSGHIEAASYLLRHGAAPLPDTSNNTLVHYAAAFGWIEVLKFLTDPTGEDEENPKAGVGLAYNEANEWKTTPLVLAFNNGHVNVADFLLTKPDVDINFRDDQGRTLLHQACDIVTPAKLQKLHYLISKKADVKIADIKGDTPLHLLAASTYSHKNGYTTEDRNEAKEKALYVADLQVFLNTLLDNGADISALNNDGNSPLTIAFQNGSMEIVKLLLNRGASIAIASRNGENILHKLVQRIIEQDVDEMFEQIVKAAEFKEMTKQLNHDGFTPLLLAFKTLLSISSVSDISRGPIVTRFINFVKKYIHLSGDNISSAVERTFVWRLLPLNEINKLIQRYNDLKNKKNPENEVTPSRNYGSGFGRGKGGRRSGYGYQEKRSVAAAPEKEIKQFLTSEEVTDEQLKEFTNEGYTKEGKNTPLHFAIEAGALHVVSFLLTVKADVNAFNVAHKTPFFLSIGNRDIFDLMLPNANVKLTDQNGRTALHVSVALNQAYYIDALLKAGADINAKDKSLSTPLHDSLYPTKRYNSVVALVNKGADVNATDETLRTPLHLAINATSNTSDASFEIEDLLISKGANLNPVDARGRTPLHYAFVKIADWKNSSAIDPIETVSSLCEFDLKINIADSWGNTPLHYAAQRGSTISSLYLIQRGADLEAKNEDGNTPLGLGLLGRHPDYAIMLMQKSASVHATLTHVTYTPKKQDDGSTVEVKTTKQTSMFNLPVSSDWQGVAYMMLDAGFCKTIAIQDALSHQKFQLVLTLLRKIKDNTDLQKKTNSELQNVFHTLALHTRSSSDLISNILANFLSRSISPNLVDIYKRTPLHYSALTLNTPLIDFFLGQGGDINALDIHDESPFVIIARQVLPSNAFNPFFRTLFTHKPNLSLLFHSQSPAEIAAKEATTGKKNTSKKTTVLSFLIANFPQSDLLLKPDQKYIYEAAKEKLNLIGPATINLPDEQGRVPLVNAVIANRLDLVRLLLKVKGVDVNFQDPIEGKSVVHFVVNPLPFGSYENVEILTALLKAKAKLNLQDKSGRTPFYYASLQDSGILRSFLERSGAGEVFADDAKPMRTSSVISAWEAFGFDPKTDAEEFIKKASENDTESILPAEIDPEAELTEAGELFRGPDGDLYDVILTKVDVARGNYGYNNFYKMQIIFDKIRELYVLFNKWGRVGETGRYQRTPFRLAADAQAEFEKVFKQKSGNNWAQRKSFERKQGKYKLVEINRKVIKHEEIVKPFDFSIAKASDLTVPVQSALKQLLDVEMLSSVASKVGVNTKKLPLGNLNKDAILQAREVLLQIKQLIADAKEKRKEPDTPPSVIFEIVEKMVTKSNEYYELVPSAEYAVEKLAVIDNDNDVQKKLEAIDGLLDIAITSKLILAASLRIKDINPLDYCYNAMDISLEAISKAHLEYSSLRKYLHNTSQSTVKLINIFRLQRKGEPERIQQWNAVGNRRLLWHGSPTFNYVGILSQGLRIAPPEAPVAGYAFGKGVYFADMFSKSIGYCRTQRGQSAFLLLSEVALGNVHELATPQFIEQLPDGFHSAKGLGRRGPSFDDAVTFPNGVRVPIGPVVDNPVQPRFVDELTRNHFGFGVKQATYQLEHNEYIVYDTSQIRLRYLVQVELS